MLTRILILESGQSLPFTVDDRIFLGEGLFETLRVANKQPNYSHMHWQRMRDAAAQLNIPFDVSRTQWNEELRHCIQIARISSGGIKVILSGGGVSRGLEQKSTASRLLFHAFTYNPAPHALRLIRATWLRDGKNPIYQIKSINYLEHILARRQAIAAGVDDVLFFNVQQEATETTIANLFIIKNETIYTPSLTCGVLPGILRSRILSLCKKANIPCFEGSLTHVDLVNSEALFVTNALQGIQTVESLDGNTFSQKHPLLLQLNELLAKDHP